MTSPSSNRDLNAHGLFSYRYLDHYWTEPERLPFLIRADGQLAGFAFLRKRANTTSVSEFFVVRRYRRAGVGKAAMTLLVERLGGDWEIEVVAETEDGLGSWREVLQRWEPSVETADEKGQRLAVFRSSARRGSPVSSQDG